MAAQSLDIELGFDPASLAALAKLEDFEPLLAAHLQVAMKESLDLLRYEATYFMFGTFQNPSGAADSAENAWRRTVSSPYRAILTNLSKYGQRLHYGFSGMTDSLGRYYAYWPAYHWAENAVDLATPGVTDVFTREVNFTIDEVS